MAKEMIKKIAEAGIRTHARSGIAVFGSFQVEM